MSGPDKIKVGDRVRHRTYGFGQVIQILKEDQPKRWNYLVQFDRGMQEQFKRGEFSKCHA